MALSPNGEIGKCTIFMYHNISVNIITIQLLRVLRLAESFKIREILVRVKRLLPLLLKNVFPNYQYKCSDSLKIHITPVSCKTEVLKKEFFCVNKMLNNPEVKTCLPEL